MARAPEFSGNIGGSYEFQNVFGGRLTASGNLFFTDDYATNNPATYYVEGVNPSNEQRYVEDGYQLLNAQLKWVDATDTYSVAVWGTNLTDEAYRITYNGNFAGDYWTLGEPIAYGITVGYSF